MEKEILEKLKDTANANIIKEWFDFREDEIATVTEEDRKYDVHFDEHFENILKLVPENGRVEVKSELDSMYDAFMNYCSHWSEKYYMVGFGDVLRLVIDMMDNK
ncbi:MAG: hypothetical protein FWF46_02070 [Oscillospiraceae bacterium]|nr:hypothetical protein [Oscillospiraceae bacterium]